MKLRGALLILISISLVSPVRAYVLSQYLSSSNQILNIKWPSMPVTWRMNSTQGSNVTGGRSQEAVFQAAFASWEGVSPTTVQFVEGPGATAGAGFDFINVVSTNVAPADLPPGVVALCSVFFSATTGAIVEADIRFSGAFPFGTDLPSSTQMDLQGVATHEIGHFLGLDHTTITSATMFWAAARGSTQQRNVSSDETAAIGMLYGIPGFETKGTIRGVVRTTGNAVVYGAIVTAVNAGGEPVASAVTDTFGRYSISGLAPDQYTVYAEPLDLPIQFSNIPTLHTLNPGSDGSLLTGFTTRFR